MAAFSQKDNSSHFLRHLLLFCQALKKAGIKVTLRQEIDTCRSLQYIDISNYNDFYHSLKTNLISRCEDISVFDRIFFSHWDVLKRKPIEEKEQTEKERPGKDFSEKEPLVTAEKKIEDITFADWSKDNLKEEPESTEVPIYSPVERLREKDFSSFSDEDMEEISKAITLITKKISLRESRRKKMAKKAHFFDFRRTIRKNICHGGDILKLCWKKQKVTRTRILLLCDVSGSMESYSRFLVQFLYGLQNSLVRVETFVFSTRLTYITPILRKEGFEKALEKISRTVTDWSGGTNIGKSLRTFNRQYASTLLYRKTIVIIISDGWDRGDEELLRKELEKLRKKAYHIIWLNPLLGSPQYQPICKGMRTALPFLDQFLPLHNLDSLMKLGQALSRIQ